MRTVYLVAFLLAAPALLRADPPASIADTIREAVAARKVEDSDNLHRAAFRDVATDGSVLVGVEVGLSRWFDSEIPYAVRPVFRRGLKEWVGGTAGSFASREVIRTRRETAKVGYAVGGMWVRTGAGMDRLCLVYYKLTDAGLDPVDTYTSPWVGTSDGGSDHYIDGGGRPIVGLLADAGRDQARSLGLVFAQVPPVPKKPAPKPEPAKAEPKKAEPKADPPAAAEAPKKSKLEEEAPPPEEEDDTGLWLILIVVCLAIGLPVGIVGIVAFAKNDPPPLHDDDRPRRRRPPRPDGERRPSEHPRPQEPPPLPERPGLARRLAPYVPPPVPAATTGIDVSTGEAPPYFLVRATYRARRDRMTRIYITPTELLVIDCGSGADRNDAAGMAAAVLTGGGLIGGLIGGAVSGMVADAAKAKGEAVQQRLNRLDLAGLLAVAGADGNLRVPVTELVGMTIDPPGAARWGEKRTRAVGTFRFRHPGRGEFSFEFLNGAEIRGAVELLRRVLGASLHVGHGWDQATAVYLTGLA